MRHQQFQRALLHARFELDRFESALSRLEAHQFPSDVAKTLIRAQKQASQKAEEALSVIEEDYADDQSGASKRLISEYRKLMSRRRYLEVLEKARSDEVPWSLVPSVERLAEQILPQRPVLMTTTPDMNYMVSWSRSADHPVVTIYLPKLHRANAFLHVLVGHELFHPIIESFLPTEKAIITPRLRDECNQSLKAVEGEPDLFSQKRLDALLSYALEAWERGVTELMCDMGAASLFGPAALWTISGFAASQDLDTPPSQENQFYPAWRLRVQVVLDYIFEVDSAEKHLEWLYDALKKAGLDAHREAIRNGLLEEKQICDSGPQSSIPSNSLIAKVYEHVFESMERAKTFIQKATEDVTDRWANTYREVPDLLKRLALLVPPSELIESGKQVSQAAAMSAIVLACWFERLALEAREPLDLIRYKRLCRLMLKAIEDAEMKRQFTEWSRSI